MSSLVGGLIGATFGSALAMIVFAPLTAVNNFLGSYYFGSGMILGEREMYQERWPQIKKELDAGRPFIEVLEEVMKQSTQGVMESAERTLTDIKPRWEKIVSDYMSGLSVQLLEALKGDDIQKFIEALLNIKPQTEILPDIEADPTIINCPAGQHWDVNSQACVVDATPSPTPEPIPIIVDPRINKTANAKYKVSPESFCHGRIVKLFVTSKDIGFGDALYQIESNIITSPTAGGNWQKIAEKTTKRIQLFNNALQIWPPISYFRFMVGTTEYWALDLS